MCVCIYGRGVLDTIDSFFPAATGSTSGFPRAYHLAYGYSENAKNNKYNAYMYVFIYSRRRLLDSHG